MTMNIKSRLASVVRGVCVAAGTLCLLAGVSSQALAFDAITPELDPGSMTSALMLLTGGLLILTGRRRRK